MVADREGIDDGDCEGKRRGAAARFDVSTEVGYHELLFLYPTYWHTTEPLRRACRLGFGRHPSVYR